MPLLMPHGCGAAAAMPHLCRRVSACLPHVEPLYIKEYRQCRIVFRRGARTPVSPRTPRWHTWARAAALLFKSVFIPPLVDHNLVSC